MADPPTTTEVEVDQSTLLSLTGPGNANLKALGKHLGIEVGSRGNVVRLGGAPAKVALAQRFLLQVAELAIEGIALDRQDHLRGLHALGEDPALHLRDIFSEIVLINGRGRAIKARGLAQKRYVQAMRAHDLTFGIGPAGTGKTYLAMAVAVKALLERQIKRIILTRPAVEAGEKLGFLPGDLAEKVNPYLRPLYDALNDMMDADRANGLVQRGQIEVAPLAFMRGRTLNDCFVILDEAQNATSEQMRMFLTRLGYESRAVVTGDITQIDLPPGARSGLAEARALLADIDGISFCEFTDVDVVRHPLVQRIVVAYERRDAEVGRVQKERADARRAALAGATPSTVGLELPPAAPSEAGSRGGEG
ncbi:MAG: PhoH family protein [Myxococcales bacterium]|nr:PhoH family protein [Myxococcales bacterium]